MAFDQASTKTAFITGASTGIGLETALHLLKKGWRVFATARRTEDLQRLKAAGVTPLFCEMSSVDSIHVCFAELSDATKRIDLLVNNAAYGQMGGVLDLSFEAISQQFTVNVVGTLALTRLCFPLLQCSVLPRVVFISSILGVISVPFFAPYCASKHALESLIHSFRMELKASGVKIKLISIRPGPVVTAFKTTATNHFHSKIDVSSSLHSKIYCKYEAREKQQHAAKGASPSQVARLIERVAKSKFPRRAYYVHWSAHILGRLFRFLPFCVQQRILLLIL